MRVCWCGAEEGHHEEDDDALAIMAGLEMGDADVGKPITYQPANLPHSGLEVQTTKVAKVEVLTFASL